MKREIIIWIALIAAGVISNTAYTVKNYLSYVDLMFLCSVILMLKNRAVLSYLYIIAAYSIKDAFLLPVFGFNLVSGMLALVLVKVLSQALYRENYVTQVFILAMGFLLKLMLHLLLVSVFYWGKEIFYFPAQIIFAWMATVVVGAVVIQIIDFKYTEGAKWLKMMFQKR